MNITQPWIYGDVLEVSAARYFAPGDIAYAGSASEGLSFAVIPADCVVRSLRIVYGSGGPGAGTSIAFAIRKFSGGSWSDVITATLANTATTADSAASEGSLSAGDCIALSTTPSGAVTSRACSVSVEIEADDATYQILLGSCGGVVRASDSITNYGLLVGVGANITTESNAQLAVPAAGAISRLFIAPDQSIGGGGKSYITTLRKDGSDETALQVTSTTTSALTAESDVTGSVSVSRGSLVDFSNVPSGTPTKVRFGWGCVFVPTTPGDAILMTVATPSSGGARYFFPIRGAERDTSEVLVNGIVCGAAKLRDMYVIGNASPSPGTYTVPLRLNGSSSSLTVTLSGAGAAEDTTHEVDVVAGDVVDWLSTPASSPADLLLRISCVFRVAAPAAGGILVNPGMTGNMRDLVGGIRG